MLMLFLVSALALTAVPPASAVWSSAEAMAACRSAGEVHADLVSRIGRHLQGWNRQVAQGSDESDAGQLREARIALSDLTAALRRDLPECSTELGAEQLFLIAAELTDHSNQLQRQANAARASIIVLWETNSQRRIEAARELLASAVAEADALASDGAADAPVGAELIGALEEARRLLDRVPVAFGMFASDSLEASYTQMAGRVIDATLHERIVRIIGDTRVGMSVVDLADDRTILSLNGDQPFTTASTYKVFVAYSMAREVEDGSMTWDDYFGGQTLGGCRDAMILYSDNDCPEEWLALHGMGAVEDEVRQAGAQNTSLQDYDLQTTPADMAHVLTMLYHRELLDYSDTNELLSLMKSQEFRDGIPRYLEPESAVANKVGWLDDVVNDVGIVYSPRGDYVFSIYTEQSEWSMVADLSRAIYQWIEQRQALAVSAP